MPSVLQPWVTDLSMMQQTVLLTAIRGPDGLPKYGCVKLLLRWYRRCILLSAMDGKVLDTPYELNGGSFTGPSFGAPSVGTNVLEMMDWRSTMHCIVDEYLRTLDGIPHHFQMHLLHAIEIVGYKHPDPTIKGWWSAVYQRLVNDFHLHPETEAELDKRLGDNRAGWLERADPATTQ